MVIDRILVACCKKDYYLTRICIASIRYWNKSIPIDLLKDLSAGNFNTTELEQTFTVGLAQLPFKKMGAYSKLYPFISSKKERVFIVDSDIVFLGDIIPHLQQFSEDILIQTYSPKELEEEMSKWFFKFEKSNHLFEKYKYPGFLFNSGQMVINTGIFPSPEVMKLVIWDENTTVKDVATFKCQDQGVINFIFADLVKRKSITHAHVDLFEWGWTYDQNRFSIEHVKKGKGTPLLLHWYGEKKGLLSSIPQNELLYFFEQVYFAQFKLGRLKLHFERLKRTMRHFDTFLYATGKFVYTRFLHGKMR